MRALGVILSFTAIVGMQPTHAHAEDDFWNYTSLNYVRGSVLGVAWTYDPADPLLISGLLHRNTESIYCPTGPLGPPEPFEWAQVSVRPVSPGVGLTGGHGNCSGLKSFSYDIDASTPEPGEFSFELGGGGVSWLSGSGLTNLGSWVEVEFFDAADVRVGRVACANSNVYFEPPGCSGPFIYGQVASPDLNGTGLVDQGDVAVFATFIGDPVTLESGWQADFNHVDSSVNAGDLAYLAGRMGKLCLEGQQKVGADNYQMDVENLMREDLRSFMAQHDITVAQILAAWDDMGFSYDRTAAVRILTSDESAKQGSSWSEVKTLYR